MSGPKVTFSERMSAKCVGEASASGGLRWLASLPCQSLFRSKHAQPISVPQHGDLFSHQFPPPSVPVN